MFSNELPRGMSLAQTNTLEDEKFVKEIPTSSRNPSNASSIPPARLEDGLSSGLSSPPTEPAHPHADEPMWPKQWQAWTCLTGCFFLMFNSWGLVNAYGTFASYYMQHLLPGRDIMLLNLVGSTQSFIVLALSFVVGRILDAGFGRWLIGAGWVLVTIGMFMLSIVNGQGRYSEGDYGLIWLTQGFVTGLGMACFFVSSSQSK